MLGKSHFPLGKNLQNSVQNFQQIHSNSLHAQERVVDMMWRMALARSLARSLDWSIPVNFFSILDF